MKEFFRKLSTTFNNLFKENREVLKGGGPETSGGGNAPKRKPLGLGQQMPKGMDPKLWFKIQAARMRAEAKERSGEKPKKKPKKGTSSSDAETLASSTTTEGAQLGKKTLPKLKLSPEAEARLAKRKQEADVKSRFDTMFEGSGGNLLGGEGPQITADIMKPKTTVSEAGVADESDTSLIPEPVADTEGGGGDLFAELSEFADSTATEQANETDKPVKRTETVRRTPKLQQAMDMAKELGCKVKLIRKRVTGTNANITSQNTQYIPKIRFAQGVLPADFDANSAVSRLNGENAGNLSVFHAAKLSPKQLGDIYGTYLSFVALGQDSNAEDFKDNILETFGRIDNENPNSSDDIDFTKKFIAAVLENPTMSSGERRHIRDSIGSTRIAGVPPSREMEVEE